MFGFDAAMIHPLKLNMSLDFWDPVLLSHFQQDFLFVKHATLKTVEVSRVFYGFVRVFQFSMVFLGFSMGSVLLKGFFGFSITRSGHSLKPQVGPALAIGGAAGHPPECLREDAGGGPWGL